MDTNKKLKSVALFAFSKVLPIVALSIACMSIYQIYEIKNGMNAIAGDILMSKLSQESANSELDDLKVSFNDHIAVEELRLSEEAIDQQKQELDKILVNYKLDTADSDLSDSLLNAAYNSPSGLCPNIIASRTTRNNLYYYVLDDYASLFKKYGLYRESISYINNNLNGQLGMLQIVQDECASIGYTIPTE